MRAPHVERLTSYGIAGTLGAAGALLWALALAQAARGPLGGDPAPTWFYVALATLMSALALAFRRLEVVLDDTGVQVRYGPFRRRLAWEDVSSVEHDASGGFYGGWGVRYGWRRGRGVWAYTAIGLAAVAFVTRDGRGPGLVVSTRDADGLVGAALERWRARRSPASAVVDQHRPLVRHEEP